jgi:hypothetical protein
MKKNPSMTALILAFVGFVLITGALFSLYRSSNEAISIEEKSDTAVSYTHLRAHETN